MFLSFLQMPSRKRDNACYMPVKMQPRIYSKLPLGQLKIKHF